MSDPAVPRELQTSTGSRECIPFENLRFDVVDHTNTDPICLVNGGKGCSDGCCRVFEWLVCENSAALTHLSCVCDPPTSAPTKLPTPRPTRRPTRRPTLRPTVAGTADPSSIPTSTPTTSPPTLRPTLSGTVVSTDAPTIFFSPSITTLTPTLAPTTVGTVGGYTTLESELDDGTFSTLSSCRERVPTNSTGELVNATYSYTYNIFYDQEPTQAIIANSSWHKHIHDFIAAQFLDCDPSQGGLWAYESLPHVWSSTEDCTTSIIGTDDETAAELFCQVWTATETVWVADVMMMVPLDDMNNVGRRNHRQLQASQTQQQQLQHLQQERRQQEEELEGSAFDMADLINQVIQVGMEQNLIPNDDVDVLSQLIYADGPIFLIADDGISSTPTNVPTRFPTRVPTTTINTNTPTTSPMFISNVTSAPKPTSASSNNAPVIKDDNSVRSSNVFIAVGVVGGILILGLILALLVRRGGEDRAHASSKYEDPEYDDQELLYPASSPRADDVDDVNNNNNDNNKDIIIATKDKEEEEDEEAAKEVVPEEPEVYLPSPTAIKSRSFPLTPLAATSPTRRQSVEDDIVVDSTNTNDEDLAQSPLPRSFKRNNYDDYESDIHTSHSPGKRSLRSPLSAMDELDHRTHAGDTSTAYDVATLSIDESHTEDGTDSTGDAPRNPNVTTDTIRL